MHSRSVVIRRVLSVFQVASDCRAAEDLDRLRVSLRLLECSQ